MRHHFTYLRYVVLHKLYVLRAGLAIAKHVGRPQSSIGWLWRLLVHDLSKFSRAEWTPYAVQFYGENPLDQAEREIGAPDSDEQRLRIAQRRAAIVRDRQNAMNYAWLHHLHRNPHHWQHHILLEDSGKTIVLLPPGVLVYEMVADWLAAGPKVLRVHSMAEAVAETIVWYAANHRAQQMRTKAKETAEMILHVLAERYGITSAVAEVESARRTRASIVIPGR